MFTTTYRHDFTPLVSQRNNIIKPENEINDSTKGCDCNVQIQVQPPTSALDKCDKVAWNSMAPVGPLVDPRLIPSPDQELTNKKAKGCERDQPNRFLQILRICYPDLYERLKATPPKQLNRRLDIERLKTTYQIDFGGEKEYTEGVYECFDTNEGEEKQNQPKGTLQEEDACAKFKSELMKELHSLKDNLNDDKCQKGYKPVTYSFADSSRFSSSGNYSHWAAPPLIKKTTFSEYMDSISKTGCVITKNNIHCHTKCKNGKNCKHKLKHTCPLLK